MTKGRKILIVDTRDYDSSSLKELFEKMQDELVLLVDGFTELLMSEPYSPVPIQLLSEAVITENIAPQIDASGKTINGSRRSIHAKMPRFKPG